MTDIIPIAIKPLYHRPQGAATAPETLAQARRWCTRATPDVNLPPIPLVHATDGARQLLDRLVRLSTDHGTSHFLLSNRVRPNQLADLLGALGQRPLNLHLSIDCVIGEPIPANLPAEAATDAVVQLQWHLSGPLPPLSLFKSFSGVGVWNHVRLDGDGASVENLRTIVLQPNIVHSWTTGGNASDLVAHGHYGQVTPLPGRPLWQVVDDPAARFLLADRLTKDRLMRLRLADDGQRLYAVGDHLEYHFVSPDRLPEGYLDEICAMVAAGGTVAATYVRSNLQRAYLIGYVTEQGVIVGNSSLKNPRPEYIASVKRQSGLDLSGHVERGYTSVRPEYRGLGIGTRLLEGLTARAGARRIFSVIGEDNTATQIIARRNRTRKVATYFSAKAGKPVGIWMPEWMIDGRQTGDG